MILSDDGGTHLGARSICGREGGEPFFGRSEEVRKPHNLAIIKLLTEGPQLDVPRGYIIDVPAGPSLSWGEDGPTGRWAHWLRQHLEDRDYSDLLNLYSAARIEHARLTRAIGVEWRAYLDLMNEELPKTSLVPVADPAVGRGDWWSPNTAVRLVYEQVLAAIHRGAPPDELLGFDIDAGPNSDPKEVVSLRWGTQHFAVGPRHLLRPILEALRTTASGPETQKALWRVSNALNAPYALNQPLSTLRDKLRQDRPHWASAPWWKLQGRCDLCRNPRRHIRPSSTPLQALE